MDQNLSFRCCFRRAFDCNAHADGSLLRLDHRDYKFLARRASGTLEIGKSRWRGSTLGRVLHDSKISLSSQLIKRQKCGEKEKAFSLVQPGVSNDLMKAFRGRSLATTFHAPKTHRHVNND